MTIEEALAHRFMNDFRNTEPELIYPTQITIELSENVKLDRKKYREILYRMDTHY